MMIIENKAKYVPINNSHHRVQLQYPLPELTYIIKGTRAEAPLFNATIYHEGAQHFSVMDIPNE
jgi:hypothetical protein